MQDILTCYDERPEAVFLDISKLTIRQIKTIAGSPAGADPAFRQALSADSRAGVREICMKLLRAENTLELEMKRLAKLFLYEEDLKARGYRPVAGVDEAGRDRWPDPL
jgi:ribonuclease HII